MSQPWDWFVITRPVAFYWTSYTDPAGLHVAKAGTTGPWVQEVLAIGNPAIWWMSIPAMVFCLGWWLTRRDWRAGAALLGVAAGWVTWLPFVSRTKFYYYALEFEPFLIICIVLCLGPDHRPGHRPAGTQGDRVGTRRHLRPCRPGAVLVLLPDPRGQDHPVLGLAVPHVVQRLDLGPRSEPSRHLGRPRLMSVFSG